MFRVPAILSRQKFAVTTGLLFIVLLATSARPAAASSGLKVTVEPSSTEATVSWVNKKVPWCEVTEYMVRVFYIHPAHGAVWHNTAFGNSSFFLMLTPASDSYSVTIGNLQPDLLYMLEVAGININSNGKWTTCFSGLAGFRALDTPPATSTPLPTATNTPPATSTPLPTATNTPPATSTPLPTATNTPPATSTPLPTATNTPPATSTPLPTATNTPPATSTPLPTATNTPTATATPLPTATNTLEVIETGDGPTGASELQTELPATPHITRDYPPAPVRKLAVTPAGTHATVTWGKPRADKPRRCLTADPPQYRYQVINKATGEAVEHITGARVADITGLTAGTRYAVRVQSYSAECDNWSNRQRVIWTQP